MKSGSLKRFADGLILPTILLIAASRPGGTAQEEQTMTTHPHQIINCAHRGASGHAPENTLAAFSLALAMGAQMAELDIQQTADDRLVVMHDDTLERTTSGKGALWQKNLAELQAYDAGSWYDPHFADERLPTIEQVVALVRGKMKLNIEVKLHGHEREVAKLVVTTLRREKFEAACIVTSFGHDIADQIKALAPELQVGYIFGKREFREALFAGPVDILSAHYRLVDAQFIRQARSHGKQVYVWTVNEASTMREMIALGVDAIITNYPDRLAKVSEDIKSEQ